MGVMSRISTKEFCDRLINSLYPQVHKHSAELFRWARFMAKEVANLNDQLDVLQAKLNDKSNQEELEQLKEGEQWGTLQSNLANDVILERNVATQAVNASKQLQEAYEKERKDTTFQAEIIESEGEQLTQKNTLITQQDIEIQVLTVSNNNNKTLNDNLEKELSKLSEEQNEALQDASNTNDKVEAMTAKIKELKDKLVAMQSSDTPNKCQHNA
ncbi:unnamed protein product [Calypogeia fissa]